MVLIFDATALARCRDNGSDRVLFRVTQNSFGKFWHGGIEPIFSQMDLLKWENSNYRSNFAAPGLPIIFEFS